MATFINGNQNGDSQHLVNGRAPSPPPPPPPDSLAPPPPPNSFAPPLPSDLPPPPPSDSLPPPPEEPVKKKKAGWGTPRDRGPLSIENILQKKKEADEAAAKVRVPPNQSTFGSHVHKANIVFFNA